MWQLIVGGIILLAFLSLVFLVLSISAGVKTAIVAFIVSVVLGVTLGTGVRLFVDGIRGVGIAELNRWLHKHKLKIW